MLLQAVPALLLLLLQLQTPAANAQGLQRSVHIKEHEVYRDFVILSAANLTEIALRDEQAWVIHVHDGFLDPDVKRAAGQVRGLVRFGLVSAADQEAIDMMKFDPRSHFFRSLPFGWETRKRGKFLDTSGFAAALEHAAASVPDDFLTVVRTETETKTVLAEAVTSKPSKFTVLFTVKDDKPTLLHKVLSRKLIRNFNFALLPNAAAEGSLKAAGLGSMTVTVPGMVVLMVSQTGSVRSSRMADSDKALQFPEILRFLVEFNRQFRPELPGDARATDRRVLYMSDVLEAERLIFNIVDAAVVDTDSRGGKKNAGGEDLKEEL